MDSGGEKDVKRICLSFAKVNQKGYLWSSAQQNFSLEMKWWKTSWMKLFLNVFTILELLISFILVENCSSGKGIKWNKIISFIAKRDLLL